MEWSWVGTSSSRWPCPRASPSPTPPAAAPSPGQSPRCNLQRRQFKSAAAILDENIFTSYAQARIQFLLFAYILSDEDMGFKKRSWNIRLKCWQKLSDLLELVSDPNWQSHARRFYSPVKPVSFEGSQKFVWAIQILYDDPFNSDLAKWGCVKPVNEYDCIIGYNPGETRRPI